MSAITILIWSLTVLRNADGWCWSCGCFKMNKIAAWSTDSVELPFEKRVSSIWQNMIERVVQE